MMLAALPRRSRLDAMRAVLQRARSPRIGRRVSHRLAALGASPLLVVLWLCLAAGVGAQPGPRAGRIVSTSPSITETLFALGLGDHVVGVSLFCRHPADVTRLPKVGTFLKPDVETIARLSPDLVLVHSGPNTVRSQLAALGIRAVPIERGALPSVFTTIREIANAAGVPERGDRLTADISAGLGRVRRSVAGRAPRRILIVVGRRTGTLTDIVAVGPGSYLDDIARLAGGVNVLAASALEYPRISLETVITLAPDVIVDVGEMGESPADNERRRTKTMALWRGQRLVTAAHNGGLHVVQDEAFVVPGPRLLVVARSLAAWLHGVSPQ